MKDCCAVTVLLYNNVVSSVLHPMSCGALQGHEEMHHKSPVISGYGNISQELHIDYGFIMSQHGNFSLNSNLKLVAQGSLHWREWGLNTVWIQTALSPVRATPDKVS